MSQIQICYVRNNCCPITFLFALNDLTDENYIGLKIIDRKICDLAILSVLKLHSSNLSALTHNQILFLDALKELKTAKSQNESSAALEEMVTKLSEEKLKTANDIDSYKRSGLKLNEELEQLNNKYQDLEADFSIKQRY